MAEPYTVARGPIDKLQAVHVLLCYVNYYRPSVQRSRARAICHMVGSGPGQWLYQTIKRYPLFNQ